MWQKKIFVRQSCRKQLNKNVTVYIPIDKTAYKIHENIKHVFGAIRIIVAGHQIFAEHSFSTLSLVEMVNVHYWFVLCVFNFCK